MNPLLDCPAPAKLNLFLHVVGRRPDGYHRLQTVFQLIDLDDRLDFHPRADGAIRRVNEVPGVPADADLTVRAARLLQSRTGTPFGADIVLHKRLPQGGGLGGGSSDAATTLIALNRLWRTGLSRPALQTLGLELGADVPFFIFGRNAFAEGVGEDLTAVALPPAHFALIHPGVAVPTARIFGDAQLTRNTLPIKMEDFCAAAQRPGFGGAPALFGRNDLESVALSHFPEVAAAKAWLARFGEARMTGSGACVFCVFATEEAARAALRGMPDAWSGWVCESLPQHPLTAWCEPGRTEGG